MKNLFNTILLTLVICSCKPQKRDAAYENSIILNDDLKEIIARYVDYQPCVGCMYELYLNKIDPHYSQIILYKGNKSLTFNEYEENGRYPVLFTRIKQKKIFVYTGGESYFKAQNNGLKKSNAAKPGNKSFDVWVISDSLNTRRIDTLDNAYPFLPMPMRGKFPPN